MAMQDHPVTGVPLNILDIQRKILDEPAKETARLLRKSGHKIQDISAMLGTNQARIAEALAEPQNSDGGQARLI